MQYLTGECKENHGKISLQRNNLFARRKLGFQLAESTAQDLQVGDLITPEIFDRIKNLRRGYGASQGNNELRAEIAESLEVSAQNVLITNGASAAIFLTALTFCHTIDEVVTVTPNFPPTLDIIPAIGAERRAVKLSFELELNDAKNYSLVTNSFYFDSCGVSSNSIRDCAAEFRVSKNSFRE